MQDKINITLAINWCLTYKKMTRYPIEPRDWIFVKGYGLLTCTRKWFKV